MASNKLTDLFLRTLKNPDKRKYSDGEGLYIFIQPSGSKLWQMTYRYEGKQKVLSFGPYPLISLKEARDKRDKAKKLLLEGKDPSKQKKEQIEVDANTFEKVFYQWYDKFYINREADTQKRLKSYFINYVFPFLGSTPIKEIEPKDVWDCVEAMERKGIVESAHRVLSYCGQIFRFASFNDNSTNCLNHK